MALDPPEAAALHGNSLSQPAEVKFCTPAAPQRKGKGRKRGNFHHFHSMVPLAWPQQPAEVLSQCQVSSKALFGENTKP